MLAESNSYSLSFSTQQVVSLASLSQETQDRSSLLGKVGDLLGSIPAQQMHGLEQLEHPPQHRLLGKLARLVANTRPHSSKALRRERSPRA